MLSLFVSRKYKGGLDSFFYSTLSFWVSFLHVDKGFSMGKNNVTAVLSTDFVDENSEIVSEEAHF